MRQQLVVDEASDPFVPDRVLETLDRHGVEYLLVGGLAARLTARSVRLTDAGPLDLLVELRDRDGGRHDFVDLPARAVGYQVGDLTVLLASLDNIVASKE